MGKKRKACGFFCYLLLFFFMGLIPLAGRAEVRVDLPTSRAQIFSRAWSASGRYFCFLQQNISQRAGARLVSTTKNLIKWRHFGANYLNTGDKTKSKYSPQKNKNTQINWIWINTVQVTFHIAWSGLIEGASVKPFVIG